MDATAGDNSTSTDVQDNFLKFPLLGGLIVAMMVAACVLTVLFHKCYGRKRRSKALAGGGKTLTERQPSFQEMLCSRPEGEGAKALQPGKERAEAAARVRGSENMTCRPPGLAETPSLHAEEMLAIIDAINKRKAPPCYDKSASTTSARCGQLSLTGQGSSRGGCDASDARPVGNDPGGRRRRSSAVGQHNSVAVGGQTSSGVISQYVVPRKTHFHPALTSESKVPTPPQMDTTEAPPPAYLEQLVR